MSESHPPPERPYPLDHEGRIARLEGIVEQNRRAAGPHRNQN